MYEEFKRQAIVKLNKEAESNEGYSQKGKAVKSAVLKALTEFANQDGEFAQSVAQSSKTLKDACEEAVKNCGNSISDFDVYQKAVGVYFPGAKVKFVMTLDLVGSAADDEQNKKIIDLDLSDLLDL